MSDEKMQSRLLQVRAELGAAAKAAGREASEIELVAVSKSQPAAAIRCLSDLGVKVFAENYLAEALTKQSQLKDLSLCWHYIGQIQSNKTVDIAAHFDWVQSLDRLKIAKRLAEQRPDHLPPLNVCVQINISREPQKGGMSAEEALPFCRALLALPRLRLRGLMAMPRERAVDEELRRNFKTMAQLQRHISMHLKLDACDTLSLGMSADFKTAIASGSTMVRIGTALFGPRPSV